MVAGATIEVSIVRSLSVALSRDGVRRVEEPRESENTMPDTINTALLVLHVGLGFVFLAHGVKHARGPHQDFQLACQHRIPARRSAMARLNCHRNRRWRPSCCRVADGAGRCRCHWCHGRRLLDRAPISRVLHHRIHEGWRRGRGIQYVATLGFVAFSLAFSGPGEFSLDHAIEFSGVTLAEYLDGHAGLATLPSVRLCWPQFSSGCSGVLSPISPVRCQAST